MRKITNKELVYAPNDFLRKKLNNSTFPIKEESLITIQAMHNYITNSLDEEIALADDLTPSLGIAANQVGLNERVCIIYLEGANDQDNIDLIMVNPQIITHSNNLIYLKDGEGCLSIPNKIDGYTHRYQTIKVKYQNLVGHFKTINASDFLAIVIQHEIDHLNGILYTDYIDNDDPFLIKDNSKPFD